MTSESAAGSRVVDAEGYFNLSARNFPSREPTEAASGRFPVRHPVLAATRDLVSCVESQARPNAMRWKISAAVHSESKTIVRKRHDPFNQGLGHTSSSRVLRDAQMHKGCVPPRIPKECIATKFVAIERASSNLVEMAAQHGGSFGDSCGASDRNRVVS